MSREVTTYTCRCGDHVLILVDGLCVKCRALIRQLNDMSAQAQNESTQHDKPE